MASSQSKKIALFLCTFSALAMPLPISAWSFSQWFTDCFRKNPITTVACTIISGGFLGWAAHKIYTIFCSKNKPHNDSKQAPRSLSKPEPSSKQGFKFDGINIPTINAIEKLEKEFYSLKQEIVDFDINTKRLLNILRANTHSQDPDTVMLSMVFQRLKDFNPKIKQLERLENQLNKIMHDENITNQEYLRQINSLQDALKNLIEKYNKELKNDLADLSTLYKRWSILPTLPVNSSNEVETQQLSSYQTGTNKSKKINLDQVD